MAPGNPDLSGPDQAGHPPGGGRSEGGGIPHGGTDAGGQAYPGGVEAEAGRAVEAAAVQPVPRHCAGHLHCPGPRAGGAGAGDGLCRERKAAGGDAGPAGGADDRLQPSGMEADLPGLGDPRPRVCGGRSRPGGGD